MNAERPPRAIPAASTAGAGPQGKADLGLADRWLERAAFALFIVLIYPAYLLVQANPQLALQVSVVVAVLTLVGSMLATRDMTARSEVVRGVSASAGLWFIYVWFHWFPLGLEYWAPSRPGTESLMVNAVAAITTILAAVATAAPVTSACMAILTSLFRATRAILSKKTALRAEPVDLTPTTTALVRALGAARKPPQED